MKTLDQIRASIDLAQASYPVLTPVTGNTSDTSVYGALRNLFALLSQQSQADQDTFLETVETRIAQTSVASLSWLADQVKAFQYGDAVSVINGRMGYDIIDESKRIVANCGIVEDLVNGRLAIKTVKANSVPLTDDELTALKTYVGLVKYAGVLADVSSIEADDLKIVCTVKIDKQVIGLNGLSLADSSKSPVWDAISAFLKNLPFTSVLNNTELTDAVQMVKGVQDFTITACYTKRPVSNTWLAYSRETISLAGHLKLHADSQFTYVN